jgi:hypothetical protein
LINAANQPGFSMPRWTLVVLSAMGGFQWSVFSCQLWVVCCSVLRAEDGRLRIEDSAGSRL